MMEILSRILWNFPTAWIWISASKEWWACWLSIEVQYEEWRHTWAMKSQKYWIWGSTLTMKKERQNNKTSLLSRRINWRIPKANSLIDMLASTTFATFSTKCGEAPGVCLTIPYTFRPLRQSYATSGARKFWTKCSCLAWRRARGSREGRRGWSNARRWDET